MTVIEKVSDKWGNSSLVVKIATGLLTAVVAMFGLVEGALAVDDRYARKTDVGEGIYQIQMMLLDSEIDRLKARKGVLEQREAFDENGLDVVEEYELRQVTGRAQELMNIRNSTMGAGETQIGF